MSLGISTMLHMMSGNQETVEALQKGVNQQISSLSIKEENEDGLVFEFANGYKMRIFDNGQSCCEHRYMHTDDDLSYFVGATLLDAELRDGGSQEEDYQCKDCQFLVVKTSKGEFTVQNYNEHNGYYGGFAIVVRSL